MKTRILMICLLTFFMAQLGVTAKENPYRTVVYKTVDTTKLEMRIFNPDRTKFKGERPAIVFFFGGGWVSGSITQFEPHARRLSELGMVAVVADYRVKNRQGTSPYDCVRDAKSAVRYLRANAKELGINPDMIAASGGSAGGHIATSAALIDKYTEKSDDLAVSCKPNALVLFNPVVDNSPMGYGFERIGENYKDFSPLHNIDSADVPPTVFFVGDSDDFIPVEVARYFAKAIERVGGRCDLYVYENQKHGFFNGKKYHKITLDQAVEFLTSIGYIE